MGSVWAARRQLLLFQGGPNMMYLTFNQKIVSVSGDY